MKTCLACGAPRLEPLVQLGSSPALIGALWDDQDSATEALRGTLDLVVCTRCGHVANESFDPVLVDYDQAYDNSLHHSPTFRRFARELARRLVEERGVRGRVVVEIGSGNGDFLEELCVLGGNRGTGYDPTVSPERVVPGVELVADYFRGGSEAQDFDLLVCRHVLEHLGDPADMLRSLRESASPDSLFYLEVPSAEFNFGPDGMWDCIYPHVSYFSATSLDALVRRCGLEVTATGRAFHGQFLWLEARPGEVDVRPPSGVPRHLERLDDFRERWASTVGTWRRRIEDGLTGGEQLVVWGAGAKGVSFLNAVDDERRLRVVDLNPRKWGRFLPGTGHRVVEPGSLATQPVSTVIITNPAYREEIAEHLQQIGVQADVVSV